MPRQQIRLSKEADTILTDLADEFAITERAAVEVLTRYYRGTPTKKEAIVMRLAVPKGRTSYTGQKSLRLSLDAVRVLKQVQEVLNCNQSDALETLLFDVARANYDTPYEQILLKRRWHHH